MGMEGKITIVTGGSRGIGRAISEELAKRGANIIVADIQEELAKTTAQVITDSYGRESIGVYVDVADLESAKAMVDHVKEQFGRVDILVNNAGVTRDNLIMRMSEEDWDMVLNVNLKGAFSCSKAVIRLMMKQRFGRIINISSVSGLAGQAGQTNYSASKAGLIGFTYLISLLWVAWEHPMKSPTR
jgi:3-oxoacyl-[acyl-carrier protein] reductase